MDWKKYEEEIYNHFLAEFSFATVVRDARIIGKHSKVERQIDVLIEELVDGEKIRTAIDAKYRNKRIDVADVEAFIAYCADVEAHKGIMISLKGYSQAAKNRAHYCDSDIELDILNFAELKQFHAFGAIPYSGGNGVFLPAPFGWIIDGTRRKGMVAALYQRGYDLEQAGRACEFMYVNFWDKDQEISTLDALTDFQDAGLRENGPLGKITYLEAPKRGKENTKIRCYTDPSYPSPEYTGFVEFEKFIFYCVMFTPIEIANKNLRKLNSVLKAVMPIEIKESEDGLLRQLEAKPWDRVAFIRLIDQYRKEERFEEYKKAVKKFIALDYGNTYTFNIYIEYLSHIKIRKVDHEIADDLANTSFADAKEIGAVFYNLGRMAELFGDKEIALQHYMKSFEALRKLESPPDGSIEALTALIANIQNIELLTPNNKTSE